MLDSLVRIVFVSSPVLFFVAGIGVLKLKNWPRIFYLWIPVFLVIAVLVSVIL